MPDRTASSARAGLAQIAAYVARGFDSLDRSKFPWNLSVADCHQIEQDMHDEIRDMDETYERVWGHPRPTGP
jgi:hypothetical protein